MEFQSFQYFVTCNPISHDTTKHHHTKPYQTGTDRICREPQFKVRVDRSPCFVHPKQSPSRSTRCLLPMSW